MFVMISGHADVVEGRSQARRHSRRATSSASSRCSSKAPRNATVTSRADAEVATINRRDVYRLIEDAPGFARKLLEAMANRIRELDESHT